MDFSNCECECVGVQYAGKHLRDLVKKIRNPFKYPSLAWAKAFDRIRNRQDNPKLRLNLKSFLHPSLSQEADYLEYCALRFQYAVEMVLERHGAEVVNQQFDLKRLADIAIDVYAMTAVLSRASRAYCVGLRNSDAEVSYLLS